MTIYLPIAELSVNIFIILGMGAAVGFLSGMFGVGGGFLITPLLIFYNVPPPIAVATGANQVIASSISGAITHFRRGSLDIKLGTVLLVGGLLGVMRARVREGKARYLGWSAGANLACPTIKTTNDMPIVDPGGLKALGLVRFQINPHYVNATFAGHHGETRDERLAEFARANPGLPVIGLPDAVLEKPRMEGERDSDAAKIWS